MSNNTSVLSAPAMLEQARALRQLFYVENNIPAIVINASANVNLATAHILVRLDTFNRCLQSDALTAITNAGYVWNNNVRRFEKNGIAAESFDERYVNPNSVRKVFVGLPNTNIFEDARKKREEVQQKKSGNLAMDVIVDAMKGTSIPPSSQSAIIQSLADGRDKKGRFTRDSVLPRGKNGRFLGKRTIHRFLYTNRSGIKSVRTVIPDEKRSTPNILRGLDITPGKGYRSFLRNSVNGKVITSREYVDFSDSKNPVLVTR